MFIRPMVSPSSYVTTATRLGYYNGTQNYFERSLTGLMANAAHLSVAFSAIFIKSATNFNILKLATSLVVASDFQFLVGGALDGDGSFTQFRLKNSAAASLITEGNIASNTLLAAERAAWAGYILHIDGPAGLWSISRNGVLITSAPTNDFSPAATLLLSATTTQNGYVGTSASASQGYIDVANFWMASQAIDPVADYSKFFSGDNKPLDLGLDGSIPTGVQPEHFAPDGDLANNNVGSEANWTARGTITAAPTSPTD
jgi:hypothetical protein